MMRKTQNDAQQNNELVFVAKASAVLDAVRKIAGDSQIFAVTDENVARLHPSILPQKNVYVMPAGEDSKTLATAENICRAMLQAGLHRDCTVVAYGGGVVGDLAGFAASVFMRGVRFINVPTTLLAQVDSAIGGKTGVNLDGFKNMVGAFKMPRAVVICTELLQTLPEREWRCGMGELIKTAALDKDLYNFTCAHIDALVRRDWEATQTAVKMAASFKKYVTDTDPTERGLRAILNLGHTVGHALEKCDNHRLSHGEYVMLGLQIELRMCGTQEKTDCIDGVAKLLAAAGLPKLPHVSEQDIADAAKADKKNGGDTVTVLGLTDVGNVKTYKLTQDEFARKYRAMVQALVQNGELQVE